MFTHLLAAAGGVIAGCMGFYWMLKNNEPRLQAWLAAIREKRKKIEDELR